MLAAATTVAQAYAGVAPGGKISLVAALRGDPFVDGRTTWGLFTGTAVRGARGGRQDGAVPSFPPRSPDLSHLAVLAHPGFVRAACHPIRHHPDQGCPQLHRPAATGRRRRSPTSTQINSASRRTRRRVNAVPVPAADPRAAGALAGHAGDGGDLDGFYPNGVNGQIRQLVTPHSGWSQECLVTTARPTPRPWALAKVEADRCRVSPADPFR